MPSRLHLAATLALFALLGGMPALHAGEPPSFYNGFDVEGGLIAPNEIDHGGPGRDGIPALDAPRFWSGEERNGKAKPGDRIIGVSFNGIAKAYPIDILDQHEIVNDRFALTPLTITFCPLCGTGMVFLAEVDGEALNFGVSGLIYNSDMLLYDRATRSLWSQVMKTAVTGPMAGSKLTQVPAQYTTWEAWLRQYPDSQLLSRDTGHARDYDAGPYAEYRRLPMVLFATLHQDTRLPAKNWVVGITADESALALPFDELDKLEGTLPVTVGNTELVVHWDREASAARAFDKNGKEFPTTSGYWFAWVAFHPATGLYTAD